MTARVALPLALVLLFCCLVGGGIPLVGHLLWGWVYFAGRVIPEVRVNPSILLTACVCLAGVLMGVHLFARWLVRSLPAPSPEAPPRRWSFVSTLAVVGMVVLAFTAGIAAVGFTHQVGWLATSPEPMLFTFRSAVIRSHSLNNLKQIAVACRSVDDAGAPLLALTLDERGRALHGWPTHLLPFMEQNNLYSQIDLTRPWDDPVNAPHFQSLVYTYIHPSPPRRDAAGFALTHYALNSRLVNGGRLPSLKQIAEGPGTSNTILVGEAAGNWKPWGHPINWRDPGKGINRSPDGFGSPVRPAHSVQFGMADGSVRSFSTDTDPDFLEMLAGPGRK